MLFSAGFYNKVYEDLPYYMMDSSVWVSGGGGAVYYMLTCAQYYLASSREEKTGCG